MENFEELMQNKEDPRYGDITILYNPSNPSERIIKKTKKFSDSTTYSEYIKIGQRRFSANHENLLYLKDIQINNDDLEILYIYEYLDDLLEIKKLASEKIVILFKDILKGIIHLKSYEMFHGDIRPDFVVYDKLHDNFILIDNLKHDLDPISCQIENIDSYRTLYLSPRFFDMILSQKDDISFGSKDEIFSLAFLCLGKYEDIENFQEFYNFDDEKFNFEEFEEKIGLICKRNYDLVDKVFLNFLKSYVFVDHKNVKSLSAEELLVVLKSIPEFKQIFELDPEMVMKEVDFEILKDIPKMDNFEIEEKSNFQHYNPFDFVKLDSLKEENRRSSESEQRTDSFRKKMDSLINLNDNVKIHQLAQDNNLFVISNNDEIIKNEHNFDKQNEVVEQNDEIDILKQINFFKLKLSLLQITQNEKDNNFYNKELAKKIELDFEDAKKNKENEKNREQRLISISVKNREDSKKENFEKKKNLGEEKKNDYDDYLKSIGLDSEILEEEERMTEMLDKKIRETVPREDMGFYENEVVLKKERKMDMNLSKFLKNKSNSENFEKLGKLDNFEKSKNDEIKEIEVIEVIEENKVNLENNLKSENLKILSQKKKIREKSARKMISKNFMILKFNKPPEILKKKKKN